MRRVARWLGWSALTVLGAALVAVLVVPWLWPFTSSGTLTPAEAARASLGAEPTFVTLEGIDVHLERHPPTAAAEARAGDDGVPLLVVLHGFGSNAASFRDILPALAELGDVVAYDRPPFGFTERPGSGAGEGGGADGDGEGGGAGGDDVDAAVAVDPYGTDAQVALLSAVIDHVVGAEVARPVVLVGHSAGGALAAEHAVRRPGEVDALVLVAPAVLTSGGAPGWVQPVLGSWLVDRWGPRLAGLAARGADRLLEVSWHDPSLLTDELRERYDEPRQVIGWEEGLWRLVLAPSELEVSEDPGALDLPVLLITGDDDRVVPTDDTRELATLIDRAELVVLPATGHIPHEESTEAFLDAIVDRWPLPG